MCATYAGNIHAQRRAGMFMQELQEQAVAKKESSAEIAGSAGKDFS